MLNDSNYFSVTCHGCLSAASTSTEVPPLSALAPATSNMSCLDLGWPSYSSFLPDLCAASIVNSRCYNTGTLTHEMADSICTSSGARLCTSDEMLNDVTAGSGCGLDDQLIWTSTECTAGSFWAAHGLSGTPPVCTPKATGLSVRCCADHVTTPTANPSTAEDVTIVGYTTDVAQGLTGSVTIRFVVGRAGSCVSRKHARTCTRFAPSWPARVGLGIWSAECHDLHVANFCGSCDVGYEMTEPVHFDTSGILLLSAPTPSASR